jgi:thiaminase/transcriptional activator TenA
MGSTSLSAQLWQTYLPLAETSLHSDFVQRLYDGTLPAENFAYYVGQDAFFLEAFARAYSIAAAKAPDWEGFQTFHQLAGGVQAGAAAPQRLRPNLGSGV